MSVLKVIEHNLAKLIEASPEVYDSFPKPELKLGMAFMLYSVNNIFKNISSYDIEEGIVDSSYRREKHDFGIDAIYLTANGNIINSIEELKDFNRDTKFVFHILQFKKSSGIEQADLLKFKEGIRKVFINNEFEEDQNRFLSSKMLLLNEIRLALYSAFASEQIHVKMYIVFNGVESNVTDNFLLVGQINDIKKDLVDGSYLYNSFEIIDAQKNLNLSKSTEEILGLIKYQGTLKYITEGKGSEKLNGYVSIVKASEIAQLVQEWQGELFEANIRDYYKRNDLNSKILDTSADENEAKYFWSYNNGLTITCRRVEELPGNTYRLHGIQIVNGCQTSNALYLAFSNLQKVNTLKQKKESGKKLTIQENKFLDNSDTKCLNDQATVLVKIIETSDSELTYRITETTNSQTPIKTFSLKANDNIQQNIEKFLELEGIFYERRINFYRNQGKKNIVSIQQLFQLYTSQVLFKPSVAKNALKVTFNNTYDKVFPSVDAKIDYTIYLVPILIDQKIELLTRTFSELPDIDPYSKVLLAYGRLHLGPLVLNEILGAYSRKDLISNLSTIKKFCGDNRAFSSVFFKALLTLKNLVQSISGNRPQSIAIGLRKSELDERIVRLISAKRVPSNSTGLFHTTS
jgi:hypothetical protein